MSVCAFLCVGKEEKDVECCSVFVYRIKRVSLFS